MYGQRRWLRRVASQMLLVWLFALTSGIVNACIVAPESRHVETVAQWQADIASAHALHDHEAAADEAPPANAALAPCAKFCADESSSPPALNLMIDPQQPLWLASAPTLALAAQVALAALPESDAPVAPVHARIPIAIAYLRLTR